MNILITGDRGFIGSHLSRFLSSRGIDVIGADIVDGFDLTDLAVVRSIFETHTIDAVVNLAGLKSVSDSLSDPSRYLGVNLSILSNLLEVTTPLGIPVLSAGSDASPRLSPYGLSKYLTGQLTDIHPNLRVMPFGNVWGIGGSGVVEKLRDGSCEELTVMTSGGGLVYRNFISVDALCGRIYECLLNPDHESLSLPVWGEPISLLNFSAALGVRGTVTADPIAVSERVSHTAYSCGFREVLNFILDGGVYG